MHIFKMALIFPQKIKIFLLYAISKPQSTLVLIWRNVRHPWVDLVIILFFKKKYLKFLLLAFWLWFTSQLSLISTLDLHIQSLYKKSIKHVRKYRNEWIYSHILLAKIELLIICLVYIIYSILLSLIQSLKTCFYLISL